MVCASGGKRVGRGGPPVRINLLGEAKRVKRGQKRHRITHRDLDYNLSFGCPQAFKDASGDFMYVNYVAIAWQMFQHLRNSYAGTEPLSYNLRKELIQLFKYHDIRSMLDIGCGQTPYFLKQFSPLAQEAGVKLAGINLGPINREGLPQDISLVDGNAVDLSQYFGDQKFDIIVSSGVLGAIQFLIKTNGFGVTSRKSLYAARGKSHDITMSGISQLSKNPVAALFLQSFSSFFLLDKKKLISNNVSVLQWDTKEMQRREETGSSAMQEKARFLFYSGRVINRDNPSAHAAREAQRFWEIWDQGANIAVLAEARGIRK